MSDILNQMEEANKQPYTQYRDRLQNNRALFFQANKDDMKIVRTNPATDRHTEM